MSARPATRFLHVANGTYTTNIIKAAGIPGACSLWADPLYEGPVPNGISDAELLATRMRFLAGHDLREWRAAIERHDSYDELVLWFEHDVFDQLNLVQLLTWIPDHLPAGTPVSLICIGSFPGRPDFKGLGELTPHELAPLLETRQPVSASQYQLAGRAWQAFRAPTPRSLDDLRREETSALPYLAAAIGRFLQEYPWTTDGLSRTERRLLELARDGVSLQEAFVRIHEGEHVYYVTDGSLAAMADILCTATPPLLTFDRSGSAEGGALRGTVTLTDTGRSVLVGHLDRVTACGIDRWMGGVHLTGRTAPWRWDDSSQRIVPR